MAHLFQECNESCKNCIFLGYYDDRQASWYYCCLIGDAYVSAANDAVDLGCDHSYPCEYFARELVDCNLSDLAKKAIADGLILKFRLP